MDLSKLVTLKLSFAFLLCWALVGQVIARDVIPELSGSLQEYKKASGVDEFSVLLSSPKRISNAIKIENKAEVRGERLDILIEVHAKYSAQEIFSFYQAYLSEVGEINYQCKKRACGNSNFWANDFFKEHALFGRDSDQFYLAGKIQRQDFVEWVMIYVIKNGFKKNKVHITTIIENSQEAFLTAGLLMTSSIDDSTLALIQRRINEDKMLDLWLVTYSSNVAGVAIDETIEQLEMKSKAYMAVLESKLDINKNRLRTKIVGPFHADKTMNGISNWHRLYLLP